MPVGRHKVVYISLLQQFSENLSPVAVVEEVRTISNRRASPERALDQVRNRRICVSSDGIEAAHSWRIVHDRLLSG
jgi:hypothetical protein